MRSDVPHGPQKRPSHDFLKITLLHRMKEMHISLLRKLFVGRPGAWAPGRLITQPEEVRAGTSEEGAMWLRVRGCRKAPRLCPTESQAGKCLESS